MANPTTVYTLSLLSEYTHTLDSLPVDLTRNFADLRELDAVLSSSVASITTKIQTLTALLEQGVGSSSKEERLWMLTEIAEEATRLKLGAEDKIRVACIAADNLKSHTSHLKNLLEHVPEFDVSTLNRNTVYPHVSARSFMPIPSTEGGRRRRGGFGAMVHSNSHNSAADASPVKRKRVANRDDDYERSPRKERLEGVAAGTGRARNGGARNRRATSPTESIMSASSHFPGQGPAGRNGTNHDPHQPAPKKRSRATNNNHINGTTSNGASSSYNHHNGHSHENGFTNGRLDFSAPPLSQAAAHPSLPLPLQQSTSSSGMSDHKENLRPSYDIAGSVADASWVPPAPTQLAGPGMPRNASGVSNTSNAAPTDVASVGEAGDADDGDERYCLCDGVSYGEMIACDDEGCKTEWFHLACIGLTAAPEGSWVCDSCKAKQRVKQRGGRGGKRKGAGSRGGRTKENHD